MKEDKWRPIDTAPKEGVFFVWLEEEHFTTNARIGVMNRHPNCTTISGSFEFDAPRPTHWRPLFNGPKCKG